MWYIHTKVGHFWTTKIPIIDPPGVYYKRKKHFFLLLLLKMHSTYYPKGVNSVILCVLILVFLVLNLPDDNKSIVLAHFFIPFMPFSTCVFLL